MAERIMKISVILTLLSWAIASIIGDSEQGSTEWQWQTPSTSSQFFIISDAEIEWEMAMEFCESQGFQLVSVESAGKEVDIIGFLASKGIPAAWTAGRLCLTGDFIWATTNRTVGPYENWRNEPKLPDCTCIGITARKEDCGGECIGQYKWEEESCLNPKIAVCELVST